MSENISKEDISRVLSERILANKLCLSRARELGLHESEQYFNNLLFEDGQIASLIEELPLAFDGMTNREIISEFVERDDSFAIMVDEVNGTVNIELSLDFWNAPYKAESEDKQ